MFRLTKSVLLSAAVATETIVFDRHVVEGVSRGWTPTAASGPFFGQRRLMSDDASTVQDGWRAVTEATANDKDCRRRVIEKLHNSAHMYNDHPPIEAINELLRQCSQSGPEMENVHKLTQLLASTGIRPNNETYQALAANYTYFPSQGSDGPG